MASDGISVGGYDEKDRIAALEDQKQIADRAHETVDDFGHRTA